MIAIVRLIGTDCIDRC